MRRGSIDRQGDSDSDGDGVFDGVFDGVGDGVCLMFLGLSLDLRR